LFSFFFVMIKLILFSYRSVNSIHPYLPVPRIPYSTACTRHNMRDLYAPSCRLCKRQKLAHMMSWYTHACLLPCIILLFSSLLLLLHFCFCFSRTNMLKVFFVYSYLMFLICFLFLPILHRYCLVLFVFFLLLLLLLCVFIYTVVPSSESFITKGFLMFLIAYLLPCRFDRLITLTIN